MLVRILIAFTLAFSGTILAACGEHAPDPAAGWIECRFADRSVVFESGFPSIADGLPPASLYTDTNGLYFALVGYALPVPLPIHAPGPAHASLTVPQDPDLLVAGGSSTAALFSCFLVEGTNRLHFESGEENGPFFLYLEAVPPPGAFLVGTFHGHGNFRVQSNTNGGPWTVIATNLPLEGGRFRLKRVADDHPELAG